jgi:methylmalonyl-CoA decarboxylase
MQQTLGNKEVFVYMHSKASRDQKIARTVENFLSRRVILPAVGQGFHFETAPKLVRKASMFHVEHLSAPSLHMAQRSTWNIPQSEAVAHLGCFRLECRKNSCTRALSIGTRITIILDSRSAPLKILRSTIDDMIGVITMNHGKANALSKALLSDIMHALDSFQAPSIRAVILRAPGGAKVFSAGHDVREFPTDGRDPLTPNDPLRQAIRKIEQFPLPVIAMVEGSVWGGGCELAFCCDLVIAAEDSTFAITPGKLGIPYDMEGMLNLVKVTGFHLLKEMFFTAQPVSATRLASLGTINHAVPRSGLEEFTLNLARQIAGNSPLILRVVKEEMRAVANARSVDPERCERIQALRRTVYESDDYQEGIRAFQEKRTPQFRGQ